MDIEKYKRIANDGKLIQRGEKIPLLSLFAWLDFFTDSSAGFSLATVSGPNGFIHHIQGHLDIHHPCPGHIKAYLRCSLPQENLAFGALKELKVQLFEALAIPQDETYEAIFIPSAATGGIEMSQHRNRDGLTDHMVSRKRNKEMG